MDLIITIVVIAICTVIIVSIGWKEISFIVEDKIHNSVECNNCGVYISRYKAQKIPYMTLMNGVVNLYYCKNCTKNYDSIRADGLRTRYYKTERFEVDNNGKKIAINK